MSQIGEIAVACIDELDNNGWCKRRLSMPDGRMCARGVINKVVHGDAYAEVRGHTSPVTEATLAALVRHIPDHAHMIEADTAIEAVVNYNNHPDVTFPDIRNLFEKVAADEGTLA